jgi:hypothetical protein
MGKSPRMGGNDEHIMTEDLDMQNFKYGVADSCES